MRGVLPIYNLGPEAPPGGRIGASGPIVFGQRERGGKRSLSEVENGLRGEGFLDSEENSQIFFAAVCGGMIAIEIR